ncbi:hypothetical protein IDH44_24480 [Paenibacillus sp. IB182496]|uniref:Transmembrane protein n=1 Tax=Paenibacillus sabuli TaxID=2772509 RepID=A0A927BZA8_9BACL|nr:hypothetical protein [Paenibacillus sabuli]MBD2848350.1 hypothetical protein [Paenibacillus sabuli]
MNRPKVCGMLILLLVLTAAMAATGAAAADQPQRVGPKHGGAAGIDSRRSSGGGTAAPPETIDGAAPRSTAVMASAVPLEISREPSTSWVRPLFAGIALFVLSAAGYYTTKTFSNARS